MRRYASRCPVCRTTSPPTTTPAAAEKEAHHHRQALHAGHHPDGQTTEELDRRGRRYATMSPLIATHARMSDTFADMRHHGGMGRVLWSEALAWLTLTSSALAGLWALAAAL
ncbi:hypothetical protein [Streptomyces buecherae]|uniref:Uncharacterized protein n=1 Tax=Streptomyces buecherae TaxID=2763006 RepID=A0A7H8NKY9_9ACTN|nr:hypothetical protein [Streptomyces buecherae]QKW55045.1 hypothetical protein HUT08_36560 [Streptomyces buecherae]